MSVTATEISKTIEVLRKDLDEKKLSQTRGSISTPACDVSTDHCTRTSSAPGRLEGTLSRCKGGQSFVDQRGLPRFDVTVKLLNIE